MLIAFIADIHSNLEALKAVLDKINSLKIKQIYCLGDIVGYGASPRECIETVRKVIRKQRLGSIIRKSKPCCLMGNHDWAVINEETSWFNPFAAASIWWTIEQLEKKDIDYLKKLKERHVLKIKKRRILLVHGSPSDPIHEYIYEIDVNEKFLEDYDAVVMGHTHVPFVKEIGNRLAINCGAVGQPRDRDNRASFVVLDTKNFKAKIVRVEYDVKSTAEKIIKAGLPEFLAQRLFLGI